MLRRPLGLNPRDKPLKPKRFSQKGQYTVAVGLYIFHVITSSELVANLMKMKQVFKFPLSSCHDISLFHTYHLVLHHYGDPYVVCFQFTSGQVILDFSFPS